MTFLDQKPIKKCSQGIVLFMLATLVVIQVNGCLKAKCFLSTPNIFN